MKPHWRHLFTTRSAVYSSGARDLQRNRAVTWVVEVRRVGALLDDAIPPRDARLARPPKPCRP